MARAKRTARADARRRYRTQLAEMDIESEDEEVEPVARPATESPQAQPARPSLGHAFRTSFRRANYREDFAILPWLVLRTKAVWLPSLLSVLAGVLILTVGPNVWVNLYFQYFAGVLPVGALFLAGFLAPRASYLAGAIVGFVGTAVLAAVLMTGTIEDSLTPGARQALILESLFFSVIGGAFVAAASAWYKRFLHLANPNRARRPPSRQRPNQRTAQRRR